MTPWVTQVAPTRTAATWWRRRQTQQQRSKRQQHNTTHCVPVRSRSVRLIRASVKDRRCRPAVRRSEHMWFRCSCAASLDVVHLVRPAAGPSSCVRCRALTFGLRQNVGCKSALTRRARTDAHVFDRECSGGEFYRRRRISINRCQAKRWTD